jgi:hypothetical protein
VEAEAAYFQSLPLPPNYYRFRRFRFHITAELDPKSYPNQPKIAQKLTSKLAKIGLKLAQNHHKFCMNTYLCIKKH